MTTAIISDEFLMVLFITRKITKDDRPLINALRQEKNWSSQRLLRKFSRKIGPGQAWTGCWRKLIPLAWQSARKAVAVRDQFARRSFGKYWTCGGAHLHKPSARLQISVRNWEGDGHFTVVCTAHCKAWSSAENLSGLMSFARWRHFIFQSCL